MEYHLAVSIHQEIRYRGMNVPTISQSTLRICCTKYVLNTETFSFNSKHGPVNFISYLSKTSLSYSQYLAKVIKYI